MMGNWFAIFVLASWPLVAIALYKLLPFSQATVWTILGGYLLLPSGAEVKFEMIPSIDKSSIPNICALIGCVVCSAKRKNVATSKLSMCFAAVCIFSPLITSHYNQDMVDIGADHILPGVGVYDAVSVMISQILFFLPFFLGWRYLRSSTDLETIMQALVVAGLLYSLPTLFEIRMSPQLSIWIYDVFPSTYATEGRYGGFRPVVFLTNGLALGFFSMTTVLAALALYRANKRTIKNIPPRLAALYLSVIVVLSKSAGALLYTIVSWFVVGFSTPRIQTMLATGLVATALLYPLLRVADVFPTSTMVSVASSINQDRADSLNTRFTNEDQLLERASERFMFGWGRFGRSRIYIDGFDISLTDGQWIITMGQFGIVGFLALFGFLSIPVFRTMRALRFVKSQPEAILLSSLALMVALNIVEQIPNASISPWSCLLAGVLLGRTDTLRSQRAQIINLTTPSNPKARLSSGSPTVFRP
jgi:hypothetical protein